MVNKSADAQKEDADAQKENVGDRKTRLKAQIERMRRHLKSGNPSLVSVAKKWIESKSDIVALVDGDIVDLMPPDPLPITNYQLPITTCLCFAKPSQGLHLFYDKRLLELGRTSKLLIHLPSGLYFFASRGCITTLEFRHNLFKSRGSRALQMNIYPSNFCYCKLDGLLENRFFRIKPFNL